MWGGGVGGGVGGWSGVALSNISTPTHTAHKATVAFYSLVWSRLSGLFVVFWWSVNISLRTIEVLAAQDDLGFITNESMYSVYLTKLEMLGRHLID